VFFVKLFLQAYDLPEQVRAIQLWDHLRLVSTSSHYYIRLLVAAQPLIIKHNVKLKTAFGSTQIHLAP
jgi:hypothetical protein